MNFLTLENVKEDKVCIYQNGDYRVEVSVQWWASVSDSEKKEVLDNCRKAQEYDRLSPFSLPDLNG